MMIRRHVLLAALHGAYAATLAFPSLLPVVSPVLSRIAFEIRAVEADLDQLRATSSQFAN